MTPDQITIIRQARIIAILEEQTNALANEIERMNREALAEKASPPAQSTESLPNLD